jgi:hypothetical protein
MRSFIVPILLAICFLFEPIFFITRGILDPYVPRLEEQPLVFAILLVLSAIIPALSYVMSKKIHTASLACIFIIITIYSSFLVWSIINGMDNGGVLDDFLLSGIMVLKGIAIGSFCLRKSVVPSLLKSLSVISIVVSIFYFFILIQQITGGLLYPGIGGATYQKASYILAQLVILNFMTHFFFDFNNTTISKFVILVINVILVLGIFYNGGRGAALVILIMILLVSYSAIKKVARNALALKLEKFHLLVLVTVFSSITIFSIIDSEIITLISKGAGRIFEIVTMVFSNSEFDGSAVSGRDAIYVRALEAIFLQPFTGYGPFWSSREVVPAHNIFLIILLQYGAVIGSALIVSVLFVFFRGLRRDNLRTFYVILAPSFTYLLFSGNYLLSFEFWIFLTLALSTFNFKRSHV